MRRDVRTDQETVVSDLSSINDKLTASASLRSEKLVWPADYEARERKLMDWVRSERFSIDGFTEFVVE